MDVSRRCINAVRRIYRFAGYRGYFLGGVFKHPPLYQSQLCLFLGFFFAFSLFIHSILFFAHTLLMSNDMFPFFISSSPRSLFSAFVRPSAPSSPLPDHLFFPHPWCVPFRRNFLSPLIVSVMPPCNYRLHFQFHSSPTEQLSDTSIFVTQILPLLDILGFDEKGDYILSLPHIPILDPPCF